MTRLLWRWGLGPKLEEVAVKATRLQFMQGMCFVLWFISLYLLPAISVVADGRFAFLLSLFDLDVDDNVCYDDGGGDAIRKANLARSLGR